MHFGTERMPLTEHMMRLREKTIRLCRWSILLRAKRMRLTGEMRRMGLEDHESADADSQQGVLPVPLPTGAMQPHELVILMRLFEAPRHSS
jgi:hypothetical protein